MTSKATYKCKCCGNNFTARTADRARGWARFCSKSCKAVKQSRNRPRHDGISPLKHKVCHTCGEPAVNGVYRDDGSIEWGCQFHHAQNTTHPFSSDALGQW